MHWTCLVWTHSSSAHSPRTRGYITSLSRSPGDQYTWLSSLTEFPPNTQAKGWPRHKTWDAWCLRGLPTYSSDWPLSPLTLDPAAPHPLTNTHTCAKLSCGPVCSWGPLFIFIGVWGFTLVKRQGQSPRVVSLDLSASCFHCEADPCLYRGE